MKLLVKFHSTFANIEISVGKFGIYFLFFFPWKWKVPVKHVFGHFWRYFHGNILCFTHAIFQFFDFFHAHFFFTDTFFICYIDWKFGFTEGDFVFFIAFLHGHGFGFHGLNFAKIFIGIFSLSRAPFEGFTFFSWALFLIFFTFDFFSRKKKQSIFHKIQFLLRLNSHIIETRKSCETTEELGFFEKTKKTWPSDSKSIPPLWTNLKILEWDKSCYEG